MTYKSVSDWTDHDIGIALEKFASYQTPEEKVFYEFDPLEEGLRSPFAWTKEEIHAHAESILGKDTFFPTGYHILIKLWMPPKVDEFGLESSDHSLKKKMITGTVGQVIRMGRQAFRDAKRFPTGPLATYGQWAVFKEHARQVFEVNEHRIATIHDDRFVGITTDPNDFKSAFDLTFEHRDD